MNAWSSFFELVKSTSDVDGKTWRSMSAKLKTISWYFALGIMFDLRSATADCDSYVLKWLCAWNSSIIQQRVKWIFHQFRSRLCFIFIADKISFNSLGRSLRMENINNTFSQGNATPSGTDDLSWSKAITQLASIIPYTFLELINTSFSTWNLK